jgi:hypothetical protein
MDKDRFEAIVAAYGADPRRWPEGERLAAQRFAAVDARAAVLLRDASDLDHALDAAEIAPDVALVSARTMKQFKARQSLASPASASFWALAASAVIGLAIGFGAGAAAPTASAESMQVLSSAFQSPYEAVDEDIGG